jgi:hypothetical protein
VRGGAAWTTRTGEDVHHATGLTIYLPNNRIELRANWEPYAQLGFAREHTVWLKFLGRLHADHTRLPRGT